MKINLLYVAIPAAIIGGIYIINDLQGQSEQTFFGSAETEPAILRMDEDVQVLEVRVTTGALVQKGDTLALLYRIDLEEEAINNDVNLQLQEATYYGKREQLAHERATILAETKAKTNALEAQITHIQLRDSMEDVVKSALFSDLTLNHPESQASIAGLRNQIERMKEITQTKLLELESEALAGRNITSVKREESLLKQGIRQKELQKLALIAPINGYVDQVKLAQDIPVTAFEDMLRIYPLRPAKVVGFIHETAVIPFRIGDSVLLSSGVRSDLNTRGQIIAASPKLVELPVRLRKFIEVRAWGREVIINIPEDNPYFIGERITISCQIPTQ